MDEKSKKLGVCDDFVTETRETVEKEYYKYLLGLVRSGEIEIDNHIYYVTIEDIIFLMRADLIPMSEQTITDEWEIEDGLWEELENGNWRRKNES